MIPRREYIFLMDVSGSMAGFPLTTAKALMRDLLGRLRPSDLVNVALFSGASMNPTVETCIAKAVRRWQFPSIKDGGIAIVNYPFNFVRKTPGKTMPIRAGSKESVQRRRTRSSRRCGPSRGNWEPRPRPRCHLSRQ